MPVLEVALRQPFAYVGAMGSRRTHDDRMKRLREAGVDEEALARLASPIGLDLGARTPEETAVSIAAEIIAAAVGRRRRPADRDRRAGSTTSSARAEPASSPAGRASDAVGQTAW